jgi:type I restriction enzyme S subunit
MRLGDLLAYEQPTKYLVHSAIEPSGRVPVLTAGKTFLLGYTDEQDGEYEELPVILFDDFTTATQWVDFRFKVKSSACKMLSAKNDSVNLRFLFELLRLIPFTPSDHKRHWISTFAEFEVDVPCREEQNAIGEVLSDMDVLVDALERRLKKIRSSRLGIAQALVSERARRI